MSSPGRENKYADSNANANANASEEELSTTILDCKDERLNLTLGQTNLTFKKWKKLECAICHHLPKDATMLNNDEKNPCQHTFCFACIKFCFRRSAFDDYADLTVRCPVCRHLTKENQLIPNSNVRRRVLSVRAYCINAEISIVGKSKGCSWQQSIGAGGESYEKHVKECKFTGAPCEKCKQFVWHEKLQQHLLTECSERTVICLAVGGETDGCGEEIKMSSSNAMTEHLHKCAKRHKFCAFNHYWKVETDANGNARRFAPYGISNSEDCKLKKFSDAEMIQHDITCREQHNTIALVFKLSDEQHASNSVRSTESINKLRETVAEVRKKLETKETEFKTLTRKYDRSINWHRKRTMDYSHRHHFLVDPAKIGHYAGEYRSPKFFARGKEWQLALTWLAPTIGEKKMMGTGGLSVTIFLCSGPYPCQVDYSLTLVSKSGHSSSIVDSSDRAEAWCPISDADGCEICFAGDADNSSEFDGQQPFTVAVLINATEHNPDDAHDEFVTLKKRPRPSLDAD